MIVMNKIFSILAGVCIAGSVSAKTVNVCFTDKNDCLKQTIHVIDQASKSINIQSYEFSSVKVADALIKAGKRGVKVQLLLDKENMFNSNSMVSKLKNTNISYLLDSKPDALYSNVLIADGKHLVTGASTFLPTNRIKVVDDVLFVNDDSDLINNYQKQFDHRKSLSENAEKYCKHSAQCKFSQATGSAKKAAAEVWSGTKNLWRKHFGDSESSK